MTAVAARAIVTVTGLIPMAVAWLILAPAAHPADIAAGLALVYAATLIPDGTTTASGKGGFAVMRGFVLLVAWAVLAPDAGTARTFTALLLASAAGSFTAGAYRGDDGL